jgi:ADP-heptose:LPS heptosyltransferase
MASGMARGAKARGKRIAFGDGKTIIHGHWATQIFKNNPNVAWPGDEAADDLEYIAHHKGNRLYNKQDGNRWVWNLEFRAQPGEIFFDEAELEAGTRMGRDFIVIEPNVPWHKTVAPNKDWGLQRYQTLADRLRADGHRVVQFSHGLKKLRYVDLVPTTSFRDALAVLSHAKLLIGPEGGLHHGAAAVGVPAVVLFGGFIPPKVTGYVTHTNLAYGDVACGSIRECSHCRQAMAMISVDKVYRAAQKYLGKT